MGKIVSSFFISLDGVVEAPDQWHFPYFNDEMGAAIDKGTETTTAFLMGRVLCEEWAAYWPNRTDEAPGVPDEPQEAAVSFASFINDVPKYVVSSTLDEATWNNTTIVSGDVAAQLREVKARTHRTPTYPLQLVNHEMFQTGVLNLTCTPTAAPR